MFSDRSTIICYKLSPSCVCSYVFESSWRLSLTDLQPFHHGVDQSQHMGFGLRVAWIRRKPQTGLICRASRYGLRLLFFWNLSDSTPTDVAPVNPDTVDEWKYPPYSGHYDGMLSLKCGDVIPTVVLQGRGSGDVAVLTTRAG